MAAEDTGRPGGCKPAAPRRRVAIALRLPIVTYSLTRSRNDTAWSLTVHVLRSAVHESPPVSNYVFGTAAVTLPPHQKTEVVATCAAYQPVELIAGSPHMHLLGSSMRFEVGKSEAKLKEVFRRDPFDFDGQRLDLRALDVSPGR